MGNPSFVTELRRRHIFRVTIAYAVTAWLLLQLGAIVFPALHAPGWCEAVLLAFLVLGFPVALLLAWAFEMTPEGVRRTVTADAEEARPAASGRRLGRRIDFVIIVVLAAAVGVLLWRQFGMHSRPAPAEIATQTAAEAGGVPAEGASAATVIPAQSIAVLPFENLSANPNNGYFAAGMREEILTRLANLGGLLVISSTSSSRFPSRPDDVQVVARQLGVATVLEGSVQKAGDEVLVNVQLIDARTDNHLWAESYQRTLDNVFGVEDEVAEKVAAALETKLTAAEQQQISTPATTNSKAYNAYLRGRAAEGATEWNLPAAVEAQAIAAYREAVRLDSDFSPAWARLAIAELHVYWFGTPHMPRGLDAAKQALDRAVALAPKSGETQLALGYYYYWGTLDYPRALAAFERALPKLPNSAEALSAMALVERRQGRWADAISHFNHAIERDPLNVHLLEVTATTYAAMRRFTAAASLLDRATAIAPGDQGFIAYKAFMFQLKGDLAASGKFLAGIDFASSDMFTRYVMISQKLLTRDYPGAIRLLDIALAKPTHTVAYETAVDNRLLGFVEQLSGDQRTAQATLLQAQTGYRAALKASPNDADIFTGLGYVEAGLGNKTAALENARRAVTLVAAQDSLSEPSYEQELAAIEAQAGAHAEAVATLQHLLSIPYIIPITVPLLRLDPVWDPLRQDPAFQALLVQKASRAPSAASTD